MMLSLLSSQHPSIVVAAALTGIYLIYHLTQYLIIAHRRNIIIQKHNCKPIPAYPHTDRIFGFDLLRENSALGQNGGFMYKSQERYHRLKTWTYTQLFFGSRLITTAEPENVKAMLATQFKDFDLTERRKKAFGPVFGHGIFTTDGKEWETSRALLRPNFTRSQVGDLDTFEKHVSKLIARLPKDGQTVDLQPLFFMLTMDSATEFLFGKSTDVLGGGAAGKRGERFAEDFTYVTENIGKQSRLGKLTMFLPDKRFLEAKDYVHRYIREYVDRALELNRAHKLGQIPKSEEGARYVFLEELAKTGMGAKKIQDELLNILLAGRDTTASLLSFVFYILARRPDVFSKLRAEILTLGSGEPTYEGIKGLKYLSWVLNETLRLWPIVPANSRAAVRDTTLPLGGGPDGKSPILVKAGQHVNYQVFVMHRRKDLFGADAEEFKPERWEHLRVGWQFLPFNGGPRICIGQQFALIEASYTIIRILQHFAGLERRDESVLLDLLTLTMSVRPGVNVGLSVAGK